MKNKPKFDSFSTEIKDFFFELKENNNKLWFDEHRNFYEKEIKAKARLFVEELEKIFFNNNLAFISNSKNSLFRINRDIRFSKDKSPYKTNLGFFFPYNNKFSIINKDYPLGLYFHYELNNSFFANGIYKPANEHLKNIRYLIADEYDEYLNIINDENFKKHFPEMMDNDNFSKRIAGFSNNHRAFEHLKRKNFVYMGKIDDNLFFNNNLLDIVLHKAKISEKFNEFFNQAI